MTTVLGADPIAPRPEDIAAAKRRKLVQDVFDTAKTKDALMALMPENQISVTELAQAMDYKLDAIAYLRELCKRQGLLTDKPVTGPACNLQRPWEAP